MLALLSALPDLMIRIDGDGRYIDVHAPFEGDLAAPLAELIGKKVDEVLPPDAAKNYMDAAKRVLTTGEVYEYEYELDVPSGRQVFDARLVQSAPNEVTSIIRNITEKRRLQEQSEQRRVELILERERRAILERFIQDASHDLRTPITALTTTGYLLEKYIARLREQFDALGVAFHAGKDTATYVNDFLETIQRLTEKQQVMTISGERLKSLIEAMFDMIRLDIEDTPPLEPGSLDAVAEAVIYTLQPEAERRGIVLRYTFEQVPPVKLNNEMMQRAIQNLVANALTYTVDGGIVAIRLHVANGAVVLEVQDSGIGIAEQHLGSIFRRFYRVDSARTARTGGSGLGLAIVHRVVQLHGGQVEVESEVGKGSVFRIILPYS